MALGLAIHGDPTVVPELKQLYLTRDAGTATAVCVALQRMGSPEAILAGWIVSAVLVGSARLGDVSAGLRTRPCFISASSCSSVSILY